MEREVSYHFQHLLPDCLSIQYTSEHVLCETAKGERPSASLKCVDDKRLALGVVEPQSTAFATLNLVAVVAGLQSYSSLIVLDAISKAEYRMASPMEIYVQETAIAGATS